MCMLEGLTRTCCLPVRGILFVFVMAVKLVALAMLTSPAGNNLMRLSIFSPCLTVTHN